MANDITNIIKIIGNEDVIHAIDTRFENAGGYGEVTTFVKAFYDNPEMNEEGNILNSWTLDNMGSKWVYIENAIDYGKWNLTSANYHPKEFILHLWKLASEIDPDVEIINEYECMNLVLGCMLVKKDEEGIPRYIELEESDYEAPDEDDEERNYYDEIYDIQNELVKECRIRINEGETF
jgi:hypothetical protein